MVKIISYEKIQVKGEISKVVYSWIRDLIILGWNVFRGETKLEENAEKLALEILKIFEDHHLIVDKNYFHLKRKIQNISREWIKQILVSR